MVYRKATKDDIEKIVDLRIKLLVEEGKTNPIDIWEEIRNYFETELDHTVVVMIAEDNQKAVATSSVIFQKYPPAFNNTQGMRAYVTNVYTEPNYRRQGINTKLLDKLVEEVKKRGISYIWLWSTEQGTPLYKKYGFQDLTTFSTMDYSIKAK